MVLVSKTGHGVDVVASEVLVEVQGVFDQLVVGVVPCLLAFRITMLLILCPVAFPTEPRVLVEVKIDTSVKLV